MPGLDPDVLSALFDPKDPGGLESLGGTAAVTKVFSSDPVRGLPDDSAVQKNRKSHGANELPKAPSKTLLELMLEALADRTLIMLCIGALASLVLGYFTADEGDTSFWIEGTAILFAVVVVVSVTSLNDYQKEKQFRKLNDRKNAKDIKCIRGGVNVLVPVAEIVVGDLIILETGDIASCDGFCVDSQNLKMDESAATGESDALLKDTKKDPFVLSGTQVLEGYGRMVVAAVGPRSYEGRTMLSLRVESEVTPLEAKLDLLAERIGYAGLAAAIAILVILSGRYLMALPEGQDLVSVETARELVAYFVASITIVVVAVPEGLPLSVTIALAYSMVQMLKDNNLVRHLSACETMGGATCICTDKTGTLTQNKMAVVRGRFAKKDFKATGACTDEDAVSLCKELPGGELRDILIEGIETNSTAYEADGSFIGSKTEAALLSFSRLLGGDYAKARQAMKTVYSYPFSSKVKRMSVVVKTGSDGSCRWHMKGASEIVLSMCTHEALADGTRAEITEKRRAELTDLIESYATDALRTICVAYRDFDAKEAKTVNWEAGEPQGQLTMLVIVGIQDPLRVEVPDAVRQCQTAGINVRMLTGDNAITAKNIAKNCGIFREGGVVMEGPDFRKLSDAEVDKVLPKLQVLARSSPTDKQRLVTRLQAMGEVVAVTGDGTNDAPQLKKANVGFAMGIAGTEVAKEACDIVLMDDNFASILQACLWGRNVFESIQKFLQFQLQVNLVAVTIAFLGALLESGESPLNPVEMLWVNLIMDSFAALALATERPTPELLNRQPLGRHAPLINNAMWRNILGQAVYQLAVLLTILYKPQVLGLPARGIVRDTVLFNAFVFLQLGNEIACRKINGANVFSGIMSNAIFAGVMIFTCIVQYLMVTFGGSFTQTSPLDPHLWGLCLVFGFGALVVGVLIRFIPVSEASPQDSHSAVPCDELTAITDHPKTLMAPVKKSASVFSALRSSTAKRRFQNIVTMTRAANRLAGKGKAKTA